MKALKKEQENTIEPLPFSQIWPISASDGATLIHLLKSSNKLRLSIRRDVHNFDETFKLSDGHLLKVLLVEVLQIL
jgi:hypothetical protein